MTYSSEVLADSPLAYWRLGETTGTTAADSSGNGRSATYTNSPTLGATGLLTSDTDKAVTVAANSSQRVVCPSAAWMNVSAFTVEAWVSFSSGYDAANGDGIVSRYASGAFQFLLWRNTSNQLAVQMVNNSVTGINVAGTTPSLNTTYHVVATCDGTTVRLYVNGSQVGTPASLGGSINSVTHALEIGRYTDNDATTPGATIDEVAIYGTALSATRISAHYSAGTAAPASGSASGTASLSLSASGSAVGVAGGTASLSLSASGAASGAAAGTASLSLSATGTATPPSGASGTASLSLTASGAAAGSLAGTAALSLLATGAAEASLAASGTATLNLSALGSADMTSGGTAYLSLSAGGAAVELYTTDLSNALDGLDLLLTATVTFVVPVAAPPPSVAAAQKYDKAIAYPVPVMVDGRPT